MFQTFLNLDWFPQRRKNSWSAAERNGQRRRTRRLLWKSCPTSAVWRGSCCEACPCMARRTSSLPLDWWVLLLKVLIIGWKCRKEYRSVVTFVELNEFKIICYPITLSDECFFFVFVFRFLATTAWCTSTATRAWCGTPWWAAESKPLAWRLWKGTLCSKEVSSSFFMYEIWRKWYEIWGNMHILS